MKQRLIKNINNEISTEELSTKNKRLSNFVQLGYHFVTSGHKFFGNEVPLTKSLWV